ncbi:hypothetical protein L9F63_003334, partial [Diploptera punctata]
VVLWEHEPQHQSRVRRQIVGFYESCCGDDELNVADMVQTSAKCREEMQSDPSEDQCENDLCVGRKNGAVDEEGHLTKGFAKYMPRMYPEYLTALVQKIALLCVDHLNKQFEVKIEKGKCFPAFLTGVACVKISIELVCPEKFKIQSYQCDQFRELLNEHVKSLKQNKKTTSVKIKLT